MQKVKFTLISVFVLLSATMLAQGKSIQFKKNGVIVRSFELTNIDEVTFDNGINLTVGSNLFKNIQRLTFSATTVNLFAESGNSSAAFNDIEKMTLRDGAAGIDNITADNAKIAAYYDLLGRKLLQAPEKGIYIIQYDNGKTVKSVK